MTLEAVVLREDEGAVARLWLNRPKQFNAMSEEVLRALISAFDDIADNEQIRVVVLGAKGKAFCAGHDLKQMRAEPSQVYYESLFSLCSQMMMRINTLPQPVIARVQGLATAAGCQLVAACDLAVGAHSAQFATSGIRFGLFCSTPAVAVSRNVSRKKAMELLLTGEFMDAKTAVSEGLLNKAVPDDELDTAVQAYIDSIVAKSAVAVRMGKEMFYKQLEMGMAQAYEYASTVMACNMMAEDALDGVQAFLDKRQPVWKHR